MRLGVWDCWGSVGVRVQGVGSGLGARIGFFFPGQCANRRCSNPTGQCGNPGVLFRCSNPFVEGGHLLIQDDKWGWAGWEGRVKSYKMIERLERLAEWGMREGSMFESCFTLRSPRVCAVTNVKSTLKGQLSETWAAKGPRRFQELRAPLISGLYRANAGRCRTWKQTFDP